MSTGTLHEVKVVMPSLLHAQMHILSLPTQTNLLNTFIHLCITAKTRWGSGPVLRTVEQHVQIWKMCLPCWKGHSVQHWRLKVKIKYPPYPLGITRISTNFCDWLNNPQHFLQVGHRVLRLQTWHWIYHGWVAVALWRMAPGTPHSHIKQLSQRMLQLPRK